MTLEKWLVRLPKIMGSLTPTFQGSEGDSRQGKARPALLHPYPKHGPKQVFPSPLFQLHPCSDQKNEGMTPIKPINLHIMAGLWGSKALKISGLGILGLEVIPYSEPSSKIQNPP